MLAIVIPYYKLAYFEQALQSLADQANPGFKVYVGDDASPENPEAVLSKFAEKLTITYKRFDENLGSVSLTRQWERCLEMTADEDWVLLLGDDDVLDKNIVAEFYSSLDSIKQNKCRVIRFATQKIDNDSNAFSEIYTHPAIEKSTAFLTRLYTENTRSSLSEYIFDKKSLLQKGILDFPVAWHSDITLVLEVSDFEEVFTINSAIVKVRVSQNSISGSSGFIRQKAKADFGFAQYLMQNLTKFSEKEQKTIIARIEKLALNNRKQFTFGLKVILLYCGRFEFPKAFLFLYKTLKK